jgi:glycerol-3-phosphate dehydrogenase
MKSRTESMQLVRHRLFDLVVIGGGIAGAGVAQNAVSRGLSVALIEKEDFSSGTSSKTTKLIHGGLRYLEQFQVKLTAELCRERARLARLAPHLVRSFSFLLPLSKKHTLFNWKMHLGLALYDLVALSSQTSHHFESLSPENVLRAAPALNSANLAGGLRFHDCITDDSRMVLSVIKSACNHGAVAINYLQAKTFVLDGDSIQGIECRDRYTGEDLLIRGKSYVNATGVWTDEVCRLVEPDWTDRVTPSKGTHIIVPASAFETNTALFLPTNDNRYVFVVPWQNALMIGTTDHLYTGSLNNPLPDGEEIDYLLHVVNSYTRSHKLGRSDITGTFSGLRPLVRMEQTGTVDDTASMSRDHMIFETANGLLNVAGGKLTSYRLMAEEVVDRLVAKIPDVAARSSQTDQMVLGGWQDKNDYVTRSSEISSHARKLGMDPGVIDHLVASYGAEAAAVVGLVELDPTLGERVCPNHVPIMAEVLYGVQREMAVSLEDVLFRRMRLGIINQSETLAAAPKVAALMQRLLDWDEVRVRAELAALDAQIEAHMEPVLREAAVAHHE